MSDKCFAQQGNKCIITSNKHCPNNCRFYKSPERFRQDFLHTKARLKKLGNNLDVTPKGLRIYMIGSIYAYPEFRLSPNTQLIYSPLLRGNVSHAVSIEDMKNSIKVIIEKDENYSVQTVLKDESLIAKYGLLQEVVRIDPDKENANTVAQHKLSELSRTKETFSFEIIESIDSYTRAGYMITVDGLDYIIEGSGHNIKNGIHFVKLDLRNFR